MKKDIKKKSNNKEDTEVNTINAFNILFVDIQVVVTILTIVFSILFFFDQKYLKILQLSLSINLLVMAFNNYKIFKKKKLTLIYVIVGTILFILLGV